MGKEVTQAVLQDFRTAPISDKFKAMLEFLQLLTLHPEKVGPEDIGRLEAHGISDEAIADAIQVCAAFNIIDRVADTLDVEIPSSEDFAKGAKIGLKIGYRI